MRRLLKETEDQRKKATKAAEKERKDKERRDKEKKRKKEQRKVKRAAAQTAAAAVSAVLSKGEKGSVQSQSPINRKLLADVNEI